MRPRRCSPLTVDLILAWADRHRRRTGRWPRRDSGPVADAPGETWVNVGQALGKGLRGLPGGSSLFRLLAERRGHHRAGGGPLTEGQILAWAEGHRARTGRWPTATSGPVAGAPGESWGAIAGALRLGGRGLPGGSSLSKLLAPRRGGKRPGRPQAEPLTVEPILGWADAHRRRTGRWPSLGAGPVPDAPRLTWKAVNAALVEGYRGLPGGSSLARLLRAHRSDTGRQTAEG
jgi:hypothetical protein